MKKCTICEQSLPLANFYTCGNQWIRGECKGCVSIAYKLKNVPNENNYKVYSIHLRDTEELIYIGRTKKTLHKRFLGHVGDRKFQHEKHFIRLIQSNLTEDQANKLESMFIQHYKPSENHYAGYKIRAKTEVKKVNKNTKWAKSIQDSNSRPVICLNDGKSLSSIREAAKTYQLTESKISDVCRGKRPHTQGYKFSYL